VRGEGTVTTNSDRALEALLGGSDVLNFSSTLAVRSPS
jgi:hypothetical protein